MMEKQLGKEGMHVEVWLQREEKLEMLGGKAGNEWLGTA